MTEIKEGLNMILLCHNKSSVIKTICSAFFFSLIGLFFDSFMLAGLIVIILGICHFSTGTKEFQKFIYSTKISKQYFTKSILVFNNFIGLTYIIIVSIMKGIFLGNIFEAGNEFLNLTIILSLLNFLFVFLNTLQYIFFIIVVFVLIILFARITFVVKLFDMFNVERLIIGIAIYILLNIATYLYSLKAYCERNII